MQSRKHTLRDLQIYRKMARGFVADIDKPLGFVGFVNSRTLATFGVGVEIEAGVVVSAVKQAITLHNLQS